MQVSFAENEIDGAAFMDLLGDSNEFKSLFPVMGDRLRLKKAIEHGPVPRTPSYSGREFSVIRF